MRILVTGGAGYIGAHVTRLLQERGDEVIVVDDLSTGARSRTGGARLVELDIAGDGALEALASAMSGVDAVIHFAAKKQVGQSVEQPARYFRENVGGMANVLLAMEAAGTRRFVFSSSAATYGMPDLPKVPEGAPTSPINPYGETKLVGEWLTRDAARAWGLRAACLRYFNVAGAGWADLGDPAILNLVPMVFNKLERGQRPLVFGTDYPTPDGTCVRDYIHVLDLARAHLDALDYLERDDAARPYDTFNVGTGIGASVREVIDLIGEVTGLDTTPEVRERRAGDPPVLIGEASRITDVLGWRSNASLRDIVASAWEAWRRDH